jgi:hypothetical protein
LLVLKESVDITLRKVLLSVDAFGLSASTPTLFLDIDLDLVEDGSVGILQVVIDVGEHSREDTDASVASREVFFDFASQCGRDTKERSSLVVGRSWGEDVAITGLTDVEEAGGGTFLETGRSLGGETGHGAMC